MYEIWLVDQWDHEENEPAGDPMRVHCLAVSPTKEDACHGAQLRATEFDSGVLVVLDAEAGRATAINVVVGLMQVCPFSGFAKVA